MAQNGFMMPASYGSFFRQIYTVNSVLLYGYFYSTSAGCHSATLTLKEVVEGNLQFCRCDKVHVKELFIAYC